MSGWRATSGRFIATLALAALAFGSVARAEVPVELRGRRVVDVEIAGETAGITPVRDVGIPRGARVSREMLRNTVQRLVESGRWADVQLDLVSVQGGVRVVAHLVPRIVLARTQISGNELLSDRELERIMDASGGDEIRRERLPEMQAAIEQSYAERGYEQAEAEVFFRDTDDPSEKVLMVRVQEGKPTRIAALRFEGAAPPPTAEAGEAIGLELGDVLDRKQVVEAIRKGEEKLRKKGWIETELGPVRFERGEQGVAVVVPARFGPHYEPDIRGHAPLDKEDVREALRLGEEPIVGPASLDAMAEGVTTLYRKHGFHDAEATVTPVRTKRPGEAKLLVEIEPGKQMRVVRMSFPGARHFEDELLRDQIVSFLQEQLGEQSILEPVDTHTVDELGFGGHREPPPREVPAPLQVSPARVYYGPTYEDAVEHIRELYQADGYLGATVGPHRLERLSRERAKVVIPVVEGPRTMLHSVQLRGTSALTSREILEASGFERGMPFSYLALEKAQKQIRELYQDHGYLYARVEPDVRFSGDRTRAEVELHVVERFPVHVGEIIVRGADNTSESLIRDRVELEPGGLYRPELARETRTSLSRLGVFSGVTVGPQDPELPARVKPVVVTVTERSTQYLDFTAGLSTGEGVRGGFEYGYRNLLGYAIGLRLRVQLAHQFFFLEDTLAERFSDLSLADRLERLVTVGATIPHIPYLPNVRTSIDLFHQRDNERDFGLDKNGVGVTFGWRPFDRITFSLSEDIENNNVDLLINVEGIEELLRETDDRRLQKLLRVPEGESTLVATRGAVSYDRRDHPFVPTTGMYASGSVEWARTLRTEDLVEQNFSSNHVKLQLTTNGYIPLPSDVVFAAQLRLGRIYHLRDDSQTYPNRRFFLGGVDTMRGYLEDALIPQDVADEIRDNPRLGPDDVLRGGDSFVLVRGELRFPIAGVLHGGVFADIGNLWARAGQLDPLDLRPTAGVGVRVATPVGPLALDYGFILKRREALDEPLGAFHFSIGLF